MSELQIGEVSRRKRKRNRINTRKIKDLIYGRDWYFAADVADILDIPSVKYTAYLLRLIPLEKRISKSNLFMYRITERIEE